MNYVTLNNMKRIYLRRLNVSVTFGFGQSNPYDSATVSASVKNIEVTAKVFPQ